MDPTHDLPEGERRRLWGWTATGPAHQCVCRNVCVTNAKVLPRLSSKIDWNSALGGGAQVRWGRRFQQHGRATKQRGDGCKRRGALAMRHTD